MDWNMIRTCFIIGIAIINGLFFVVIKFNDLRHLTRNVNKLCDKVGELSERVSKMEGICSVCAKDKQK